MEPEFIGAKSLDGGISGSRSRSFGKGMIIHDGDGDGEENAYGR